MAQESFSGLLIISRNPEFLQVSQNLFQNLPVFFHSKPAFRAGNDIVGTGCIESGHHISFFVGAKGELCLIPVSPWFFHPHNLRHFQISKSADTGQMIPHLFRLEIKLGFIGHSLQLAAAALACKIAPGRTAHRRRFQHFHETGITIMFFHFHDLCLNPVADHRIFYKDGHAVGFSDSFPVNAEIFYCQFDDIVFLHQLLTRLSNI